MDPRDGRTTSASSSFGGAGANWAPAASSARASRTLSDFDSLSVIGKGGFGTVYLCRDRLTGELLAIKSIKKRLVWVRNRLQEVQNERDLMAWSDNPLVVKLRYSFQDQRYLHLAMEYCPGGDLRRLLDLVGYLTEEEARPYMSQMVVAAHSIHLMGYTHRDLKPANFLIDAQGYIKLADFGLACRLRCAQNRHSREAKVMGSPQYICPDLLDPTKTQHGPEVDCWSLGCIFFEMLAGSPLFAAGTPEEVFALIARHDTVVPARIAAQCFSPAFADVLGMLLRASVDRRSREDDGASLGPPLEQLPNMAFFTAAARSPYFQTWSQLLSGPPAFVPQLDHADDTRYFERPKAQAFSPLFHSEVGGTHPGRTGGGQAPVKMPSTPVCRLDSWRPLQWTYPPRQRRAELEGGARARSAGMGGAPPEARAPTTSLDSDRDLRPWDVSPVTPPVFALLQDDGSLCTPPSATAVFARPLARIRPRAPADIHDLRCTPLRRLQDSAKRRKGPIAPPVCGKLADAVQDKENICHFNRRDTAVGQVLREARGRRRI